MDFETTWNNSSHITPLISKEEGQHLWDCVMQIPEGSIVVEIGSYVGKSSFILATACKERQSTLICIDPFVVGFDGIIKYKNTREIFKKNILDVFDNVILLDMTSEKASQHINKIDYLFVDGDHDYKGVKIDCIKYLPKLKEGCCASFHDYGNENLGGIKKAVDQHCGGWETVNNVWSITTKRKPYGK